jgi:hypothetical protein
MPPQSPLAPHHLTHIISSYLCAPRSVNIVRGRPLPVDARAVSDARAARGERAAISLGVMRTSYPRNGACRLAKSAPLLYPADLKLTLGGHAQLALSAGLIHRDTPIGALPFSAPAGWSGGQCHRGPSRTRRGLRGGPWRATRRLAATCRGPRGRSVGPGTPRRPGSGHQRGSPST